MPLPLALLIQTRRILPTAGVRISRHRFIGPLVVGDCPVDLTLNTNDLRDHLRTGPDPIHGQEYVGRFALLHSAYHAVSDQFATVLLLAPDVRSLFLRTSECPAARCNAPGALPCQPYPVPLRRY